MIHLGIDVAKDELVVFDGERLLRIPNRAKDIHELLAAFGRPGTLAAESTGGYEREALRLAHEAGWKAYALQPSWVKAHARARGTRAKTDAVDARLVRGFLLDREADLRPWSPPEERIATLQGLFRQRQRLADDVARMRTRYRALGMDEALLKSMLAGVLEAKGLLDGRMSRLLREDAVAVRLLSVPGVGPQTAAAVLCALGRGAFLSAEGFVAFAGLDPCARESGRSKGQRRISKRGDQALRRALFMAAMNGSRLPAWNERYRAMKQRGMPPTKALVALARKIATVLFAVATKERPFDPEMVRLKKDGA